MNKIVSAQRTVHRLRAIRNTPLKEVFLTVLLLLALAPTAHASPPLTTPPLFGDAIVCSVVNVGTKPVSVTAEVVQETGQQNGVCGATLNPGEALGACGGSVPPGSSYYCRFTGGTKKNLRGSIVSMNAINNTVVATMSLPAQ